MSKIAKISKNFNSKVLTKDINSDILKGLQ